MTKTNLSVLIPVKNAQKTFDESLRSVLFAAEIWILDDSSTDKSIEIAKKYTQHIFQTDQNNFADKRNRLLLKANYDWIFYLDADEVVPISLKAEIETIVKNNIPAVYRVKRRNFFLGREMYQDKVERLFHKSMLMTWAGKVHESPVVKPGTIIKELNHPLKHYTHRSIKTMLEKTNEWSVIEAELRLKTKHPQVVWWRIFRVGMTTFFSEYIGKKLYCFGREGLFEAYFQLIDKMIIYTKLWEKQQNFQK